MSRQTKIMDEEAIARGLKRITHEIIERNNGADNICILGVKKRGVPLAYRLAANIKLFEGVDVPVGVLDTRNFRDDISEAEKASYKNSSEIPFSIEDKTVIIVDDVLYTGRTARAAIEAVFYMARPRYLQLAVLIDRGHRELPIRPDFVVKNIPTSKSELVMVKTKEFDNENAVYICAE